MSESTYRTVARMRIKNILRTVSANDQKALRRALRDGYPFAQRTGWAYKVWLAEIKKAGAMLNRKPRNTRQRDLFEDQQ